MEIRQEVNGSELGDMLWSGGKDHWDSLLEDGVSEKAIMSHLEEVFPDGADLTSVNDYLWFDYDSIREYLGLADWDDMPTPDTSCYEEIEYIKNNKEDWEDSPEDAETAIKYLEELPAEAEKCKSNREISDALRTMVEWLQGAGDSPWQEWGRAVYNELDDLAEFIEKVDG